LANGLEKGTFHKLHKYICTYTAIPYREGMYRVLQGNLCNENRIPAMRTGFPVMKTGFSL